MRPVPNLTSISTIQCSRFISSVRAPAFHPRLESWKFVIAVKSSHVLGSCIDNCSWCEDDIIDISFSDAMFPDRPFSGLINTQLTSIMVTNRGGVWPHLILYHHGTPNKLSLYHWWCAGIYNIYIYQNASFSRNGTRLNKNVLFFVMLLWSAMSPAPLHLICAPFQRRGRHLIHRLPSSSPPPPPPRL